MRESIQRFLVVSLAVGLSLGAFSSCSNDPTLIGATTTGSNITFNQIARQGNAGLLEVFTPWSRHDSSNRTTPLADIGAMQADINTFTVTGLGNRSVAIGAFNAGILTPDALIADLSQTGSASYLGVSAAGQINDYCTGTKIGSGKFGGRALTEDVVDTTLGLVFGSLVPQISANSAVPGVPAGAIPDDGKEKDGRNGTPVLNTDNVGCSDKHYNLAQFPYLGAPR
jgi:hypothetical protein